VLQRCKYSIKYYYNSHPFRFKLFLLQTFTLLLVSIIFFIILSNSFMPRLFKYLTCIIIFFVNIVFILFSGHDISNSNTNDNFDANNIRVFLLLVMFIVGGFSILKYYDEYRQYLKANSGFTVGLRTWGCEVRFTNIEIEYLDSNNLWQKVQSDLTRKIDNWIGPVWSDKKSRIMKDCSFFYIKGDSLLIRNCGVVLNPTIVDNGKGARNLKIKTSVELIGQDNGFIETNDEYYSMQFCLNVPINTSQENQSEMYIALEFFFKNFTWAKMHLPALDIDEREGSILLNADTESDEILHTKKKALRLDSGFEILPKHKFDLDAVIYGDNIVLKAVNSESNFSKVLYRGKLSNNGFFQ
jgi:hypothetical protein